MSGQPVNDNAPGSADTQTGGTTDSAPEDISMLSTEDMILEDIESQGKEEPEDKDEPDDNSEEEDDSDADDSADEDDDSDDDDSEDEDEDEDDSDSDDSEDKDDEDDPDVKDLLAKDDKDLTDEDKAAIQLVGKKRFSKIIDQRNEFRTEVGEIKPKLEAANETIESNAKVMGDIDNLLELSEFDPVLKELFGDKSEHWYMAGRKPTLDDFHGDTEAFSNVITWIAQKQAAAGGEGDDSKTTVTTSKEVVDGIMDEIKDYKDHTVYGQFLNSKKKVAAVMDFMKDQWKSGNKGLTDVTTALYLMDKKAVEAAISKGALSTAHKKQEGHKKKVSLKPGGGKRKSTPVKLSDEEIAALPTQELIKMELGIE